MHSIPEKKKSITFDVKTWAQKRALNISGYQKKKEVLNETSHRNLQ